MKRVLLISLSAIAVSAGAAEPLVIPHSFIDGKGHLPQLTVIVEADCAPCIRAYTDIVAHRALLEPILVRPIRWVPVGRDGRAQHAAAVALQKGSIDGFTVMPVRAPYAAYLAMARENAEATGHLKGYPVFMIGQDLVKVGYSNWSDFSSWLRSR